MDIRTTEVAAATNLLIIHFVTDYKSGEWRQRTAPMDTFKVKQTWIFSSSVVLFLSFHITFSSCCLYVYIRFLYLAHLGELLFFARGKR